VTGQAELRVRGPDTDIKRRQYNKDCNCKQQGIKDVAIFFHLGLPPCGRSTVHTPTGALQSELPIWKVPGEILAKLKPGMVITISRVGAGAVE